MNTKLLSTSGQFNDAMLRQLHVTVYHQDELLDVGGIIEKQTKDTVKIDGSYFFNHACQFVVSNSWQYRFVGVEVRLDPIYVH